jgi:hypothetical protein
MINRFGQMVVEGAKAATPWEVLSCECGSKSVQALSGSFLLAGTQDYKPSSAKSGKSFN